MHKTDQVLNFTHVAMNGTRKKMSDLLDYYLSDKRPRVPTYSKSRFKGNYFIEMGGFCLYTAFDELCFTL